MNQRDGEYLNFEERLSIAIESELSVGDFLHGTWPRGGAIKLPISGNGGRTFDYARQGHPGGEKVESIIAALETGRSALLFSDGMRAIASATEVVVKPGDLVFVHSSLYGGTLRYFNLLSEWGG
jgi:cystathionine beta-lyase/cystathionine gamma-synthase